MEPITILALSFSITVILGWVTYTHHRLNKMEEFLDELDLDLDQVENFLESNTVSLEKIKNGN